MPGRSNHKRASDTCDDPERWWQRKKLRLRQVPSTRSYPLNPARQYERDCEMVLRAAGRFLQRTGFCPNTKALARRHTWNEDATRRYLEDLLEHGYVEAHCGCVWNLTASGWDFIRIEPLAPVVPYDFSVIASSIREMRSVVQRLGTPEIAAAYEEFTKDAREFRVGYNAF